MIDLIEWHLDFHLRVSFLLKFCLRFNNAAILAAELYCHLVALKEPTLDLV